MHDNFSSLEDSSTQNYLSAAEQFPDQFALYQQYMQFLDAEELRLDGMTMRGAAAEESLAEAEAIYHQLMDESIHDLLRNRIQARLEELKAL